jgi:hypothetical protein
MKAHIFRIELPPLDGLQGLPLARRWNSIERLLDRALQIARAGSAVGTGRIQCGDQYTEFTLHVEATDLPDAIHVIRKVLRKKRVPERTEFTLFEQDGPHGEDRELCSFRVYEDDPWAS